MFKINPAPTFRAKVQLTVAGSEAPATIDVEFRHKSRTALLAWLAGMGQRANAEVLGEIIVSWNGPMDDAGAAVPYSAAALDQLLDNYPQSAHELFEAYRKALGESRAKN